MSEQIKLSGVPETMLLTVYARAKESIGRGVIRDRKAEELIAELDHDFSLAEKDTAMRSGVIARTLVLDRLTASWLTEHPGAVVANIACGLDTRCCRVGGYAHWYNLDLPEVIALREKSVDGSHVTFTWGVKNGAALAKLLPDFRLTEEHSLTEGMAVFAPVYKALGKLTFVRNISHKIIVLERT